MFCYLSWFVGCQLQVRRCLECGQPLPDTYQRPADEDWTSGIFGCAEDPESCKNLSFGHVYSVWETLFLVFQYKYFVRV